MGQQRLYLELAWLLLSLRWEWFRYGPFISPPTVTSQLGLQFCRCSVCICLWEPECACVCVSSSLHSAHRSSSLSHINEGCYELPLHYVPIYKKKKKTLGRSPLALRQFVRIRTICFVSLQALCADSNTLLPKCSQYNTTKHHINTVCVKRNFNLQLQRTTVSSESNGNHNTYCNQAWTLKCISSH